MADPIDQTRAAFISIIGAPNVGKSTLLNTIQNTKISIVSPKSQTTRSRITGIHLEKNSQLIFVDTPGIFDPKGRLDRAMVSASWESAQQADIVLVVVDAKKEKDRNTLEIISRIKKTSALANHARELILLFNKIDLVKKEKLLKLIERFGCGNIFSRVFLVSAKTTDGISDLLSYLASIAPPGPWLYPPDQLSDLPDRLFAAEVTREKLYLQLSHELPYSTTIETEKWEKKTDGSIRIEQVLYVERYSQKAIILGKNGARIKSIGTAARTELEDAFGCTIHLFLFVKVFGKWRDSPKFYREWGLNYNA